METIYGTVHNLESVAALMHKYNGKVCPSPEYAATTLMSLVRTCVSNEREFLKEHKDESYRTYAATACGFIMLYSCESSYGAGRYREIRALFDPCALTPKRMGLDSPELDQPIG